VRDVIMGAQPKDWDLEVYGIEPAQLRDLLDRLPDTKLPYPTIDWPPLASKPLREQFDVLKPIPRLSVD